MKNIMIRGILTEVTEGEIKRFSGSGRSGETFADREYFQHYGFTSRPLAGAEGILLKQGNNIILVASDDRRYRLKMAAGEVALYTDEGDCVHLKRGRVVEIHTETLQVTAGTRVVLDTPVVETTGEITAQKDITDQAGGSGRSMASMRGKYNSHKHPEDASGDTEIPRDEDLM